MLLALFQTFFGSTFSTTVLLQFAIRSAWKDAAPSKSTAGVMTVPQALSTAAVQTTERENEGTQTEDNPQPGKPSKKAAAGVTLFVQRCEQGSSDM
jgi:hypothetical protein